MLEVLVLFAGYMLFTVGIAYLMRQEREIRMAGVETEAVVSRVTEEWNEDASATRFVTYASYRDGSGTERQSRMETSAYPKHEEGKQIRIRFTPGQYDSVNLAK